MRTEQKGDKAASQREAEKRKLGKTRRFRTKRGIFQEKKKKGKRRVDSILEKFLIETAGRDS